MWLSGRQRPPCKRDPSGRGGSNPSIGSYLLFMKPTVKKLNGFLKFFMGSKVGITLAPFGIYLEEKYHSNKKLVNHEKIHWEQQLEMILVGFVILALVGVIILLFNVFSLWVLTSLIFPFIFFYVWYFIEWLIKAVTPPRGAYKDISFEREAYDNDQNLNYLETRKRFSWFKRIKK